MSSSRVQHIASAEAFDQALAAAGDNPVIVDFKAAWCGPCKMIAPTFALLSNKHTNVVFLSVDVDQVPQIATRYNIEAMPTFQIFKNGTKVDEFLGADPKKLTAVVEKYATSA